MKTIYFATSNKGKVVSMREAPAPYQVDIRHVPFDLPEPRIEDVREIAKAKVEYAYAKLESPVFAIDAGFYIPSQRGFPKTYVNFALATIDISGILKLVEGTDRLCEYRNCLAYLDHSLSEPEYFESRVKGTIAATARGEMKPYCWSRLSRIFIPQGESKIQAEMTESEFNLWREKRKPNSFAVRFGEWVSKRK